MTRSRLTAEWAENRPWGSLQGNGPQCGGNCHGGDCHGCHRIDPTETGEDGFTLENVLTDSDTEEQLVERIALREAIGKLPEREALVINLRYFHGLTQERVARVLQVSQVQVSRIEKKALGHLREMM